MALQQMFEGRSKGEMVGLFLALLELVRNRRVRVVQDRIEGLITVQLRDEAEHPAAETATPASAEPAAE